ncbi:MAG: transposase family protein [Quadrisphaera sp.]
MPALAAPAATAPSDHRQPTFPSASPPPSPISASTLPTRHPRCWKPLPRHTDPRRALGVRHQLLVVPLLVCCVAPAQHSSYIAITEWIGDAGSAVVDALGWDKTASRRRLPSESAIRRFLNRIDASALEAALRAWIARHPAAQRRLNSFRQLLPRAEQTRVITLDGKIRRGSAQGGTPEAAAIAAPGGGCVHLVAALDIKAGAVLGQAACDMIGGKGGEIAIARQILEDFHDCGLFSAEAMTMDALHIQRAHAGYLHATEEDSIMTVKGNKPTLPARLKALALADVSVGECTR